MQERQEMALKSRLVRQINAKREQMPRKLRKTVPIVNELHPLHVVMGVYTRVVSEEETRGDAATIAMWVEGLLWVITVVNSFLGSKLKTSGLIPRFRRLMKKPKYKALLTRLGIDHGRALRMGDRTTMLILIAVVLFKTHVYNGGGQDLVKVVQKALGTESSGAGAEMLSGIPGLSDSEDRDVSETDDSDAFSDEDEAADARRRKKRRAIARKARDPAKKGKGFDVQRAMEYGVSVLGKDRVNGFMDSLTNSNGLGGLLGGLFGGGGGADKQETEEEKQTRREIRAARRRAREQRAKAAAAAPGGGVGVGGGGGGDNFDNRAAPAAAAAATTTAEAAGNESGNGSAKPIGRATSTAFVRDLLDDSD